MSKKSFRAIIGLATALIVMTPSLSQAAPTRSFYYGDTSVALSSDFVGAIGALKLDVKAYRGSWLRNGRARFGITDGDIDLANAKAEIIHSGGLRIVAGKTTVELRDFIIDTMGAKPVLTGKVVLNDDLIGRVPLFDLTLPALTLPLDVHPYTHFQIPGVKLTLSETAAGALNAAFGVSAFTAGFNIGTATVSSFLFDN